MSSTVRSGCTPHTNVSSEQPERDSSQTAVGDGGRGAENYQGGGEKFILKMHTVFSHVNNYLHAAEIVFVNVLLAAVFAPGRL